MKIPSAFLTQRSHPGEVLQQGFPQPSQPKGPTLGFPRTSQLRDPTLLRSYNRDTLTFSTRRPDSGEVLQQRFPLTSFPQPPEMMIPFDHLNPKTSL
ncbi:hypothetical protein Y032_0013g1915 [Ancylostoma ceylanicum]|uniref:Uncharacterized protein n=1 Tax=Ancylostoma ceylanicum TaxID=53326 RepID=A0A016VB27_9BILA|nr:hypothetical protein Y032_0013g1915 [Ancylostoma ceylanicum]